MECYLLEDQGWGNWSATGLMLAPHCYRRPGELSTLTWRRIAAASPKSGDRAGPTLRPLMGSQASKTGEFDETFVVVLTWLFRLPLRMPKEVRSLVLPVLDLPARDLQQGFEQAQASLNLRGAFGRRTLSRLRHFGATADA